MKFVRFGRFRTNIVEKWTDFDKMKRYRVSDIVGQVSTARSDGGVLPHARIQRLVGLNNAKKKHDFVASTTIFGHFSTKIQSKSK